MSDIVKATGTAVTGNYERDLAIGSKIRDAAESLQWMLGDWAVEMTAKHGESQRTLVADMTHSTGVPFKTLEGYATAARAFPAPERSGALSWSHHARAAAADNPVEVLQQAEEQGLSVRDTERLAKGLPLGGEATATKESSAPAQGTNLEESALLDIETATAHLTRALATINKPGFRLTVAVGQDLMTKLEATSKPFVAIEAKVNDEVGSLR